MIVKVWLCVCCSEDLALGDADLIRTISKHVHSPVLPNEGWEAARLLGARRILSHRAWPATTRCLLSGRLDGEGRLGIQEAATAKSEENNGQQRLPFADDVSQEESPDVQPRSVTVNVSAVRVEN